MLTDSGIPLKPVYRPVDTAGDYETTLNDPGAFPFTRGARSAGQRPGWIQRELSGEGDPARSNAQFKHLLSHGQNGLDVIGDAATMGLLDADHPFARHSVGTQGVSLSCLEDYRALYRDLPLDEVTLSHSLPAGFLVPALYAVAKERGVSPAAIRGSVWQPPYFGEDCGYAVHMPFKLRVRLAVDSIAFCALEMPKFHAFLEDTYYISENGIDAVEEMALGFIEIRGLIRELLRRGLSIDSFGPRIAILVNCRMDFFEEVAKIRATRRLFAKMMRDEFGAQDPRSWAVNIAAHTSGLSLTAQQPVNNIVRGATQTLALACAGVQALEVSTFDEAYRTPSPEAHVVGLRTQQIVESEARVNRVADPLGGSYFVEALTDQMESKIREMVEAIEAVGEIEVLADSGWFRRKFVEATERYMRAVEDGTITKVGVNVHAIPPDEDVLLKEFSEEKIAPYHKRIEWLTSYRADRSQGAIRSVLGGLHDAALDESINLMHPILTATQAGATMGEMAGVLRMAYGRAADPFGMDSPPLLAETAP